MYAVIFWTPDLFSKQARWNLKFKKLQINVTFKILSSDSIDNIFIYLIYSKKI